MTDTTANLDHRAFLKALTSDQNRALCERSDARGAVQFLSHIGLIGLGAWAILARVPGWPALIPLQGILVVFLFTGLHETVHRTAFKTRGMNDWVARLCGFAVILPAHWFRFFHFAHHRFTQDPEKDPELASPKPNAWGRYLWTLTGLPVWKEHATQLLKNARGRADETFLPEDERAAVTREARWMIAAYVALIAGSVALTSDALIWTWVVPAICGQPFLRLYLMAEHGGCPFTANMFENTRTTLTNPLVRFVAWNMPYHAEHHTHPGVPFHRLGDVHALIQPHLKVVDRGYARVHAGFVRNF